MNQLDYMPVPTGEELPIIRCIMCGRRAAYYAPKSMEPLCMRCCRNNDEAFKKK